MRTGNERIASFARQVDQAFMARTGLAYEYVRQDLESSGIGPSLSDAAMRMSPSAFAADVSERFGMKGREHDDAVPYNRRLAALVEFASENPEWSFGAGAIYREGPEGIERLSPGRDVGGKRFGFAASVSGEGTLSAKDGRVVELTGEFEPRTGAIDIGDAIDRLEATYDADNSFRM